MIIPLEQLSKSTLFAIIETFILQEGTEYGEQEVPLADKIEQVHQQLIDGSAVVVFSELHETVNIVPIEQVS